MVELIALRPCIGRGGIKVEVGDRLYLKPNSAAGYVSSGRARYAKVAYAPEFKEAAPTAPPERDEEPPSHLDDEGEDLSSFSFDGYADFSAREAIEYLSECSYEELVAIEEYEASNKARKTVLQEIDHLLPSEED